MHMKTAQMFRSSTAAQASARRRWRCRVAGLPLAMAVAHGVGPLPADARSDGASKASGARSGPDPGLRFERIATFSNYVNATDSSATTVAEIIAASRSGDRLIYTDSPGTAIGFIDITDPSAPAPLGTLALGGEPTSVSVLGDELALVAVDTSPSFTEPSGHLAVVELATRSVLREIPLGGQPDSVALSPSGRFAAIAIENERDEERVVEAVEGGLPQAPGGSLAIVDLEGPDPARWSVRSVGLAGFSTLAPEDPEPEFVDINTRDEAVVTLQENNHLLVVDLRRGVVTDAFEAGAATLTGVDTREDGIIALTDTLAVRREPDAVAWLPGPRGGWIATANEGDLAGGSRGFSIFDRSGNVVFDSGSSLEELAVQHGHYPEARSDAKGTEPEAIEYARFGSSEFLFVASERGSFVAVYALGPRGPRFVQLLPAPLGPEGVLAIPSRGLLVVSGEDDTPPFGVRSTVMVYELGRAASYPHLVSADDAAGQPIPWSALSGMAALRGSEREILAVSDAFYAESRIFRIDVAQAPAVIRGSVPLQGGSAGFDAEGITVAPDGTYWIASEGDGEGLLNRLVQADPSGAVLREVALPSEIEACRAATANTGTLASGFEGVSAEAAGDGYRLLVAQQRGWDYTTPECEALDDDGLDATGAEPSHTRLWIYTPLTDEWSHVSYELEPIPEHAAWVGLSEVTAVPGGYLVLERDNRSGDFAGLKALMFVPEAALDDGLIERTEKQPYDLIPELRATNGWISDKPEGVAVTDRGAVFVVTDNDGVDDWSGETWLLRLGGARPGRR